MRFLSESGLLAEAALFCAARLSPRLMVFMTDLDSCDFTMLVSPLQLSNGRGSQPPATRSRAGTCPAAQPLGADDNAIGIELLRFLNKHTLWIALADERCCSDARVLQFVHDASNHSRSRPVACLDRG